MMWTETERAIMSDVYKLLQAYYDVKSYHEYWINMIRDAGEIIMKHDNHPLAKHMSMSVIEYFESEWKKMDVTHDIEDCKQMRMEV